MGDRATGTPLVEEDDAVALGIEETAVRFTTAAPRSTVDEHRGNSARCPAFLHVELVGPLHRQAAGKVGTNGGIKGSHQGLGWDHLGGIKGR